MFNIKVIVIRGDCLWKTTNITYKNNGAAVYVGSSLKVHNPLFSVRKLWPNKLMGRVYWSIPSKWWEFYWTLCTVSGPQKRKTKQSDEFQNHSNLLTMSKCNIRRIFRLQKRAARVILGLKTRDQRTVTLFKRLDWLPSYHEINVNKLCIS